MTMLHHELERQLAKARRTQFWATAWLVITLCSCVALLWLLLWGAH